MYMYMSHQYPHTHLITFLFFLFLPAEGCCFPTGILVAGGGWAAGVRGEEVRGGLVGPGTGDAAPELFRTDGKAG